MDTQLLPIFAVLRYARDSRLAHKHSELLLLYSLILRCNPKKQYSTFVGYDQLCVDTACHPKTVQAAASALEERGLISRRVRPNQSNLWFVNVPVLKEAAEGNGEPDSAFDESSPFDLSNLGDATPVVSSKDVTPDVEVRPRSTVDDQTIDEIKAMLHRLFPGHKTYEREDAEQLMSGSINKLLALSNSANHCLAVLRFKLVSDTSGPLVATIMKAEALGGYLQRCFHGWLKEFDDFCLEGFERAAVQLAEAPSDVEFPIPDHKEFLTEHLLMDYLQRRFGDDLIQAEVGSDDEGRFLKVEITDTAKAKVLGGRLVLAGESDSLDDVDYLD